MKEGKIGVGIITCDRPEFLKTCLESIDRNFIDQIVIVDDGNEAVEVDGIEVIKTSGRTGVAKTKNIALKHLHKAGCDYLFLIEDDTIVKDNNVFMKYIDTYKVTGIPHLNYGPGTPFNRRQTKHFDLHNRHELDQESKPNPKKVIDYGSIKLSLYEHVAGMFSFYTREIIDKVGYMDEEFYNAWEHVDHTYRIIKEGYHPPFWFFADVYDSHNFLSEAPGAINKSSINKGSSEWIERVQIGRDLYIKKHGHAPNQPPYTSLENVKKSLKKINENSISN